MLVVTLAYQDQDTSWEKLEESTTHLIFSFTYYDLVTTALLYGINMGSLIIPHSRLVVSWK